MMPDLEREERVIALESLGLESRPARDERTVGIVIERLDCPLAVVTGTSDVQRPRARYEGFHRPRTHIEIPGASHWGLVVNRRVLPGARVRARPLVGESDRRDTAFGR